MPRNLQNTYVAPGQPHLKKIIITGIIMALSSQRSFILPGSPLYDYVLRPSTNAQTGARWIQNFLFYFLFGAHAIETAMFTKKLRENGVDVMSMAWLKWMGTCFVGGKFCFEWFDQVIGKTI